MNHTDAIVRRKERLLARIEQQRSTLAATWDTWEKPAALIDRGVALITFLKLHPLLLTAVVAAVTVLRVRKLKGWLARGVMVWQIWRSVGAWVRQLFA
jgi:hypothetical protein